MSTNAIRSADGTAAQFFVHQRGRWHGDEATRDAAEDKGDDHSSKRCQYVAPAQPANSETRNGSLLNRESDDAEDCRDKPFGAYRDKVVMRATDQVSREGADRRIK